MSLQASQKAIDDAVQYLQIAQKDNGLFVYEFDFLTSTDQPNENIVRQAGSGFALGQVLSLQPGHKKAQGVLKKALTAYAGMTKEKAKGIRMLVDKHGRAPTGATALALLGALYYYRATGDDQFKPMQQRWCQSLIALHNVGKGLRKSPQSAKEDDYYNGEGWLALSLYHEIFPEDKQVAQVLGQLDTYFLKKYTKTPSISFYHWAMMAAELRYKQTGEYRFLKFMIEKTTWMLDKKVNKFHAERNQCYLGEGLLAVLHALPANTYENLRNRLITRLNQEMRKSLSMQIKEGQESLDFPQGVRLKVPYLSKYKGAFLNHAHSARARVDCTQHCLSALVRQEELAQKGMSGHS